MPPVRKKARIEEAGLTSLGTKTTRMSFDLGVELRDRAISHWNKLQEIGIGGTFPQTIKELIALGLSTQPQLDAISGARKRAYIEAKYAITMGLLAWFREQTQIYENQLTEIRAAGQCSNCGHSWLEEQAPHPQEENVFPQEEIPPDADHL